MDIKEMHEFTRELVNNYNEDTLIKVAKSYKQLLDEADIQVNIWIDAIEELIEKLDNNETTITSVLEEAAMLISEHLNLLDDFRQEGLITYQSLLCAPIFLLQVVYIYKHADFDGSIFSFNNVKFDEIMEVEQMNELKAVFRAKSLITGKYIKGAYFDGYILEGSMIEANEEYCVVEKWTPVDKSTLGAFTGCYDKNENPIFEGNHVEIDWKDTFIKAKIVEYNSGYNVIDDYGVRIAGLFSRDPRVKVVDRN